MGSGPLKKGQVTRISLHNHNQNNEKTGGEQKRQVHVGMLRWVA